MCAMKEKSEAEGEEWVGTKVYGVMVKGAENIRNKKKKI